MSFASSGVRYADGAGGPTELTYDRRAPPGALVDERLEGLTAIDCGASRRNLIDDPIGERSDLVAEVVP
jgi:hypothetical protein